ncbi:hypothetical protein [Poseidonocella sp. HB161398]|uniref:hypothetical protein n=1 Tax=Poseidonocella sp. HB161398 TaxID=2320855 RepID=UPI0011095F37|nr:hypothetical protein [Poseidonocella sp. HB161398]
MARVPDTFLPNKSRDGGTSLFECKVCKTTFRDKHQSTVRFCSRACRSRTLTREYAIETGTLAEFEERQAAREAKRQKTVEEAAARASGAPPKRTRFHRKRMARAREAELADPETAASEASLTTAVASATAAPPASETPAGTTPFTHEQVNALRAGLITEVEQHLADAHEVIRGTRVWTSTQVRLFGKLIDKVLPNLSASEHLHHQPEDRPLADLSREELEAIISAEDERRASSAKPVAAE